MKKMTINVLLIILCVVAFACFAGLSLSLILNKNQTNESSAYVDSESHDVARRIAEEGMILLKNDYSCLPANNNMKIGGYGVGQDGETSKNGEVLSGYQFGGGGSGWVCATDAVSPKQGLQAAAKAGKLASYTEMSSTAAADYDRVLYFITRYSAEDSDLVESDFYLTEQEKTDIQSLINNFGKQKVAVMLNTPSVIDTSWLIEKDVGAIMAIWMGGQEAGTALANVITGEISPSGKTTDTWAKSLTDYPTTANYANPYYVKYEEDLYVGYRYFETFDKNYQKVNYEFGYGLSYTDFSIKTTAVKKDAASGEIKIYVTVKNTGDVYSGKEVVQVYYSTPDDVIDAPAKQLIAFEKTDTLAPGESQRLVLSFNVNDMAQFDDTGKIQLNAYVLQRGDYKIYVGNSVKAAGKNGVVTKYTVSEHTVTEQCNALTDTATNLDKRLTSDGTYETLSTVETSYETHYYSGNGAITVDAAELFDAQPLYTNYYQDNGTRAFWHDNFSCFTYYTGYTSNKIIRQLNNEGRTIRLAYKFYIEKAGTYNIDFFVSNEYTDANDMLDVRVCYDENDLANGISTGIVINSKKQTNWKTIEHVSGNTITFSQTGYAYVTVTPKNNYNCGLDSFVIYNNGVSATKETALSALSSSNRDGTTEEVPASGVGFCVGNLRNGSTVDFVVNAEAAGNYYLNLYASNCLKATDNFASVKVNGVVQSGNIALMRTAACPLLGGSSNSGDDAYTAASADCWWKYANSSSVLISLKQGQNTITLTVNHSAGSAYESDTGVTFVNLHSIVLRPESMGAYEYSYSDNTADYDWKNSVESPYSFSQIWTYTDVVQGKISVEEYVKQFDVYELAGMAINNCFKNDSSTNVGGIGGMPTYDDYANAYGNEAIWNLTKGVTTEYGLPYGSMSDGPAGVHFRLDLTDSNLADDFHYATYFPCMTMLASTWNKPLAEEFGVAYGKEANAVGITVMLSPGVNIHKNPLCGRNFEYFSEDPFVAGWMATAVINGCQSEGVLCSIKHFATNNQETCRFFCDSRVSARALREIYLEAFRIAVTNANPGTVMNSYNFINGIEAAESYDLNTVILRNEWGFTGTVESDWGFWHYENVSGIIAGTNMHCFGNGSTDLKDIVRGYQQGIITYDQLAENAADVVRTLIGSNAESTGIPQDAKSSAQTARATEILSCSDGSGTTWHYLSTKDVTQIVSQTNSTVTMSKPSGIFGTAKLETNDGKTYLSNLDENSGAYYYIYVKEAGEYEISYNINVSGYDGKYGDFKLYIDGILCDTFTNPNNVTTSTGWYGTGILTGDGGKAKVNLKVGGHRIFIDSEGSYYNLHDIIFDKTEKSSFDDSITFDNSLESQLVQKVEGAAIYSSVTGESGLKFTLSIAQNNLSANTSVYAIIATDQTDFSKINYYNYADFGFALTELSKAENGDAANFSLEKTDIQKADYSTAYTVKFFVVSASNGITVVKETLSDTRSCKQVAEALVEKGYPRGKVANYLD